jgi:hypothetical protein
MFDEFEIEIYEKENEEIQKITKDHKQTPIRLEELQVGQIVLITFCPYSQRYIYTLTPKLGQIVNIPDSHDLFQYKIKSYKSGKTFESDEPDESEIIIYEDMFHPCVSYYGDSLGYDYSISLIENFNL